MRNPRYWENPKKSAQSETYAFPEICFRGPPPSSSAPWRPTAPRRSSPPAPRPAPGPGTAPAPRAPPPRLGRDAAPQALLHGSYGPKQRKTWAHWQMPIGGALVLRCVRECSAVGNLCDCWTLLLSFLDSLKGDCSLVCHLLRGNDGSFWSEGWRSSCRLQALGPSAARACCPRTALPPAGSGPAEVLAQTEGGLRAPDTAGPRTWLMSQASIPALVGMILHASSAHWSGLR